MVNPFAASFGVNPPLLVGRDPLLEEFADALDDGPGSVRHGYVDFSLPYLREYLRGHPEASQPPVP